eukprot:2311673-Pyramimonas_sp.AAC.1
MPSDLTGFALRLCARAELKTPRGGAQRCDPMKLTKVVIAQIRGHRRGPEKSHYIITNTIIAHPCITRKDTG